MVNVLALLVAAGVVFALAKMTLSFAATPDTTHVAGHPTFDQVARGGRALMAACARHAVQQRGRLPADLSALFLVDEGMFATDPVVKPALVPDDVDHARLRGMTAAARAALLNKHAPFDYYGADVSGVDPAHGGIIILVGRGYQTNARTESDQVGVKFVGYADGRTAWVKEPAWPVVWRASQDARQAAGLRTALLP